MSPQGSQPVRHPRLEPHSPRPARGHALPMGSIVVGVDGSPSSIEAVEWAARQAALEHRPIALLHSVHCEGVSWLPAMGYDPREIRRAMREEGERLVSAAERKVREVAPDVEVHLVFADGDARAALLEASRAASMLVLGSRGRGRVASTFLGSVGVTVVRHASCPVVVRRPEPDQVSRGVVVGTDMTEGSLPVMEYAYQLASTRGLPLTVLVNHRPSPFLTAAEIEQIDRVPRERVAQWMADLHAKFPDVRVKERDAVEPFARALATLGTETDLVVVGGQGGASLVSALRRSLAVAVVEHLGSTVVVVPLPVGVEEAGCTP
jgi:nucleotide-binding universal stress UspA family protein